MNIMNIPVKKTRDNAKLPFRATEGAAGADMSACLKQAVTIEPGRRADIPLGIAAEIPAGYVGLMFARSSLGLKHGVSMPNSVGVIDSDYRGEMIAALINHSDTPFTVNDGDRLVQLVIVPCENAAFIETDTLSETARGTGGFGSTG